MARLPSACPLDCPDTCGLEVDVEDGRLRRIAGRADHPFSGGFICGKVRGSARRVYSAERVCQPMRRVGAKGSGEFEALSWDAALELIARRLQAVRARWGGSAILPVSYGGSNGLLSQDGFDARLFDRLGASRLLRTVCAAPTGRAAGGLYGKMPGVALQCYDQAQLIVVWGCNPSATSIHLVPVIRRAQRAGARLVVVDPRRTPLAGHADLHLPVLPGTDLPVALSIIRWLFDKGSADTAFLSAHARGAAELRQRAEAWSFERAAAVAGLQPELLERFATLYAASSPAVIRCGWGVERNRNGGSAVAAILALPSVAGKFGVAGGGYTMSNSSGFQLDPRAAVGSQPAATRAVNLSQLGKSLLRLSDPPLQAVFVYNMNPLASCPAQNKVRQGLLREDLFSVVFEQVWTDTARLADVVLPATTFFEHRELKVSYGSYALRRAAPCIAPVGEARSNAAVFAELCARLGLNQPGEVQDVEGLETRLLSQLNAEQRQALCERGLALPDFGDAPVQFGDVFPKTPDGKVDLCPAALDDEAPGGLYCFRPAIQEGSLQLISPAIPQLVSSTFGGSLRGPIPLQIHPGDAADRGLFDQGTVRVFNASGEVVCQLACSTTMRRGVVCLPKGLWARHTANGCTANALAPDTLSDLGGGACYNDARVEVEAWQGP